MRCASSSPAVAAAIVLTVAPAMGMSTPWMRESIIIDITSEGIADEASLEPGDVIYKIADVPIRTAGHAAKHFAC